MTVTLNHSPLTVAICTSGRGEILLRTLDFVLPQSTSLPAEILIVDQQFDHPPAILDRLTALDREGAIRWLCVNTDSLTGKRNIALREASAEIVLFIDDDVILPPDFLLRHLQHYQQSPTLAGLTGQVYHAQDPDNPPGLDDPTRNSTPHFNVQHSTSNTQHSKKTEDDRLKTVDAQSPASPPNESRIRNKGLKHIFPFPNSAISDGPTSNQAPSTKNQEPSPPSTDPQSKIQNPPPEADPPTAEKSKIDSLPVSGPKSPAFARPAAGKQVSSLIPSRHFIGCNHSVKKTAAMAIGGYDEQFIASSQCEDFDMADRLANAGYYLAYDPDLWLIHLRARSGGTRDGRVWPEWTRTANIFMYMFRHAHIHKNHASLLWRALRTGPLRKEVVKSPAKWPDAWTSLVKGANYGWRHRKFIM